MFMDNKGAAFPHCHEKDGRRVSAARHLLVHLGRWAETVVP